MGLIIQAFEKWMRINVKVLNTFVIEYNISFDCDKHDEKGIIFNYNI